MVGFDFSQKSEGLWGVFWLPFFRLSFFLSVTQCRVLKPLLKQVCVSLRFLHSFLMRDEFKKNHRESILSLKKKKRSVNTTLGSKHNEYTLGPRVSEKRIEKNLPGINASFYFYFFDVIPTAHLRLRSRLLAFSPLSFLPPKNKTSISIVNLILLLLLRVLQWTKKRSKPDLIYSFNRHFQNVFRS